MTKGARLYQTTMIRRIMRIKNYTCPKCKIGKNREIGTGMLVPKLRRGVSALSGLLPSSRNPRQMPVSVRTSTFQISQVPWRESIGDSDQAARRSIRATSGRGAGWANGVRPAGLLYKTALRLSPHQQCSRRGRAEGAKYKFAI